MNTSAASTQKNSRKQTGIRRMIIKLSRKLSITLTWRPRARVSRLLAMLLAAASTPALALPTAGTVVSGNVSETSTDTSMTVTQTTDKAIVNRDGYSIGYGESVTYIQPSTSSVILERVVGGNASEIFGQLTANGQIFLLNPNGVLFAPGAQVDVGGLVASTLGISDGDFMAGNYTLQNDGSARSVVNQASLSADKFIALVAPTVDNRGNIDANGGTVALAAGDRVNLEISGDGLLNVSVDAAAAGASISHSGAIIADGGKVFITAKSADALLDTVLNVSGLVRAQSLSEQNGVIRLDGGSAGVVAVSGTLDASGNGGKGGTVTVLGDKVGLFEGAHIDASGTTGGGTVLVGGNYQGKGPEQNASMTYIADGASIDASATGNGNGGSVVVWSNDATRVYGNISVRGGASGGDGGFVETSSHGFLDVTSAPDLSAALGMGGLWLIDPADLTINNTGPDNDVNAASPFAPQGAGGSVLTWGTIDTALLGGDVVVTTVGSPVVVGETGAIFITEAGSLTGTNDLTINAADTITVDPSASITMGGEGSSLTMSAANGITLGTGADISTAATATTGVASGSISLSTTNGDIEINSTLTTGSADVNGSGGGHTATSGNITVNAGGSGSILGTGNLVIGNANITNPLGNNDTAAVGNISLTGAKVTDGSGGNFHVHIGTATNGNTNTQGALSVTTSGSVTGGEIRIASDANLRVSNLNTLDANATTVDVTVTGGNTLTLTSAVNLDIDNITLSADEIDLTGGANSVVGTGTLTLTPDQAGTTISLNGADGGATDLNISTTDYAAIASGFSSLTIGRADAGMLTVSTTALKADTTLLTGANVALGSSNITGTGFDLNVAGATGISGTGSITTDGGAITLITTGVGAAISVGNLDTSATASGLDSAGSNGGSVLITTVDGNIATGSIDTSGGDAGGDTNPNWSGYLGGDAGSVTVAVSAATVARSISLGAVTATGGAGSSVVGIDDIGGNGGNGGVVSITAGSTYGASLSASTISTDGGMGGTANNAVPVWGFVVGGTGGNAGSITVATTQGVSFSGAITAVGGAGGGVTVANGPSGDMDGSGGAGGTVSITSTANMVSVGDISTVGGAAASSGAPFPGAAGTDASIVLSAGTDLTPTGSLNAGTSTIALDIGQAGSGGTLDLTGVGTLTGTATATGGAGTDTLMGENVISTWTLDGTPTYSGGNTVAFSNIEVLQGGSAIDTFNVTADTTAVLKGGDGVDVFDIATPATLTGSVDGEAAGGTLQGTGITSATLTAVGGTTGFNGTTASITGVPGFSNITTIIGAGGGTLTGLNADSTWALDGTPTYTSSNTLAFSGFGTLQGGSAIDTFNVTADTTAVLKGGGGADVFDIGAALTGSVDGEAGSDTLQGSLIVNALLSSSDATNGFGGTADDGVSTNTTFSGIDTLTGAGTGTLTGRGVASTWTLDGSPTYADGTATLAFGGFATLQGGSAADAFNVTVATTADLKGGAGADIFDIGAALTGSVDGETGSDTLQGSGITDVTLTASDATGFDGTATNVSGGFSNIETIAGTGTLTGQNAVSTWALDGSPTYTTGGNTLNFSGFATLQGGTAADTFNVTSPTTAVLKGGAGDDVFDIGAALTGSVDGEAGSDTLQGSLIADVTLTGSATDGYAGDLATTANLSGGFSNINVVAGTGTLTGENATSTWALGATQIYNDLGGNGALTFSGFGTLQGGTATDIFNVTAATAAILKGGAGDDAFDIGAALTGSVDGEADSDTLEGSGITNVALTVADATGFDGTATNVSGGFSNIEAITGAGTGTLTGLDADSAWVLDATSTYTTGGHTLDINGFAALQGGSAVDTFTLGAGYTSFGGSLNGGAGTDTLAATNGSNTWVISGANSGTLNTTTVFSGIENITGGSAADAYQGTGGSLTGNIADNSGTSTLSGTLQTGGSQTYDGAVTLGADATVTAAGNATFGSTIDGAYNFTITSTAGDVSLGGAVGAGTPLTSLTVTTTGAMDLPTIYAGALNVTAHGAITDSGDLGITGNASFNNNFNDAGAAPITLGDGGATTSFGTLTVNSAGDVDISADSAITFYGSSNVGGNLTLTSSNGNWTAVDAWSLSPSLTVMGDTTVTAPNGGVVFWFYSGSSIDFKGDVDISANSSIYVKDVNDVELGRLASQTSYVYVDALGKITGNTPLVGGCGVAGEFACGADIQVAPGQYIYLISEGAGTAGGIGDGAAVGDSFDTASIQKAIHIDTLPSSNTDVPGALVISATEGSKTYITVNTASQFTTLTTPEPIAGTGPIYVQIPVFDTDGTTIIGYTYSPPVSGMNLCYLSAGPQCFNLFDLSPVTAAFDISGILNAASQDLFNSTFGTDNIRVAIQNGFLTEFGVVPPGIDAIDGDGISAPVSNLVLVTEPLPPILIDEEELKRKKLK